MAFLRGIYGGGGGERRRSTSENEKGGGGGRRRMAVAAPRPVRQLYWKLRSRLRPKRHAGGAARSSFGYDPESYSRNFDDTASSQLVPI
uniref:Uncharacterized protein n=1 Tax=Leersia perrieri TaxID=77586 RepID=A0A0D9XKF5_9ORYZ